VIPVVGLVVQLRFTMWTGAAVPVPVRLVALGVFDALLANEAVADAAPDTPGVNVTVNICPVGTLVNARVVGVTVSVAGATAVPLSDLVRLGLEVSDVMETLPLKLPLTAA
jgi:hypothetical protein